MTTLLCMGFSDPATIRKALRLAKNDINEAVALLTNERPGLDYGGYEPMDSGGPSPGPGGGPRGDSGGDGSGPSRGGSTGGGGGFDPPPAYHEVVDAEVSGVALTSRERPPRWSPVDGERCLPCSLAAGLLGGGCNETRGTEIIEHHQLWSEIGVTRLGSYGEKGLGGGIFPHGVRYTVLGSGRDSIGYLLSLCSGQESPEGWGGGSTFPNSRGLGNGKDMNIRCQN